MPVQRRERGDPSRYCVVCELGRGSMGSVWLAYDGIRERHVALKRVLAPSAEGILRLKREFRAIAPLRHTNLVRLHELWSDNSGSFFTMEFIEGYDLRYVLAHDLSSRSTSERIRCARDVTTQVLLALGFLHAHGVIHRDLKPSNLMVAVNGAVKLVDFGILAQSAGDVRGVTLDRRGGGTPPYMAPEQARGEAPTPASDMYSLGVLLLEMADGILVRERDPSDRFGSGAMRRRLERIQPALPEDLAPLFDALLQEDHRLRPDAPSALEALGQPGLLATPRVGPRQIPETTSPHGRDDVKNWLAPHLESVAVGGFDVAIVEGHTRSEKRALLTWMHGFARSLGGLVLVGGSRADEHAEYNVLDAAVDDLAGVLLETISDAELGRDLVLASTAFPVLAGRRCPGASVSRSRAFDALIRILASLAGVGGVYLLIGDLHLADEQSLAFIDRLLERKPPGVALLATVGTSSSPRAARSWLDGQGRLVRQGLARSTDAWIFDRDRSPRPNQAGFAGRAVLPVHRDVFATQARRKFIEPEDTRELCEGGRDVSSVGAKGHGQKVRRLLLGARGFDEGQMKNATLLRASRR